MASKKKMPPAFIKGLKGKMEDDKGEMGMPMLKGKMKKPKAKAKSKAKPGAKKKA